MILSEVLSDYNICSNDKFIVAVGDPHTRHTIMEILEQRGASFSSFIHPTAYVSSSAEIGKGTIICPFAFVGPFAKIGQNVVLNIYASVGHDSRIGQHSVLSPYATVNGNVEIKEKVFMGTSSVVTLGNSVGANTKLSAGCVAMRNVPDNALAVGNPASWRVMYK